MKNLYTYLLAAAMICLGIFTGRAQVVTTEPALLTTETEDVTIYFHADWGSQGLKNLPATDKVYAHTGVITSLSNSPSDWKYAPKWGTNTPKYECTRVDENLYKLHIGNMREYYGITNPDEQIERLAFVFRNTAGTKEGKTVGWTDIFLTIFPADFPADTKSKNVAYPGGIDPVMGTSTNADGSVTFCLAAPGKDDVLLIGSWNNYALTADQQMNYCDVNGIRYFWITIGGLDKATDYVYYYMLDKQTAVGDPYAHLVVTPDDKTIPKYVFPDCPAYDGAKLPGVHAAVYNSELGKYDWKVNDFQGVPQSELLVYELLIRDFTGDEGKASGNGTVKNIYGKLGYLKELGINAIELMPIMEFNGNKSWGYNTNFYMAPDKAYGAPADYKELIDKCHELGIAVILDIVFNQTDGNHPWWLMYNVQDNPCYNGSAPHSYSVLNDWNQDSPLVQQQFKDALKYWLTEYRVDGFRFDLVKGLGDNNSYGNTYNEATNTFGTPNDNKTNAYNASRVARMKSLHAAMMEVNPNAYFINENLAGTQEENEMAQDAEINWANVNNSACQFAMGYASQSALNRFYAPSDGSRTWGSTVSYAVSHDEERPAYKQGKWGVDGVKGNPEMSCRRLGSLAAQMLMCPGAHMIWQFEEFGADQTTKSSDGGNNTGNKKVVWSYLDKAPNKALHQTYTDLLQFRGRNPELFRIDIDNQIALVSTTAGRYVKLVAGDKAAYLFVNPTTDGDLVINTGVDLTDTSRYRMVSVSDGVNPALTSANVTLPAGAYVLYATANTTGIDEVVPDGFKPFAVSVAGNDIEVTGEYNSLNVYSMSGQAVGRTALAPGIYVVVVDGQPTKVAVR
ncbi:MAG: alpha-amylase family glycosyl hydrolase [Muribaculaceae bacterium]